MADEALAALRHDLHRHPDVAHDEAATAERLRAFLSEHGLEPVADDVGGHGLLYRLGDGAPVRLLRADLDGLPLQETTGAPHASQIPGRHHACGHDGHMAMLAGALVRLAADPPEGTVLALFQPAEETGEGMALCLDHLALCDAAVKRAYAIHNVPGHPRGTVLLRDGVAAVASTGLRLRFAGVTSHAAEPERGVNPIPVAAALVSEVLAAPDRVGGSAVAAIVGIEGGGERYGTSAGDAALYATLRADRDEDLETMVAAVTAAAQRGADEAGVVLVADRVEPFPSSPNHPDALEDARAAAAAAGLRVVAPERPFPWSEDFGQALHRWPGVLLGLGSGTDQPDLHAPDYDFPDDLIDEGILLWMALAGGTP